MWKRLGRRLLILSGAGLVCLIVLEIGLRIGGYSHLTYGRADPYTGYSLRPNGSGWSRVEGEAFVRINSKGLRDEEHTTQKPPGTIRIAVLGDSYAEAVQVPVEQTFWSVMERRLAGCVTDGRTVEALNFGVSGYGTAQELLTLRHRVWEYDPDIVLLTFTNGNDLRNNIRALDGNPGIPYFVYQDGELVLDDSFKNSRRFRLRRMLDQTGIMRVATTLRTGQLLVDVAQRLRSAETQSDEPATDPTLPGEVYVPDLPVFAPPVDPVWEEAWRVTEGLLLLIRDEVAANGAKLMIATLTSGIQVDPDPAVRAALQERLGVPDLFYPDLRVKALAEREGIPVVVLAPEMQALAQQTGTKFHGFGDLLGRGHWNADGHRVGGELIAERLCAELLPLARGGADRRPAVRPGRVAGTPVAGG